MDMSMLQQLLGQMNSSGLAAPTSPHLIEFKAGKLKLTGTTVTADPRKGKFVLTNNAQDGLMHLQWIPRPGTEPEDDLIVFPGDFSFEHVPECTTGRVYLLTFKPTQARRFFWMQDLKTDQDEERVKKVVELLNKGPSAAAAAPSVSRRSGSDPNQQLRQALLGNTDAPSATPAPAAAAAASTPASLSTPAPAAATSVPNAPAKVASSAPSQASATPATPAPSQQQLVQTIMGAMQQQNMAAHTDVELGAILDPAKLQPFLRDPQVLAQLMPHLPESQRSIEALEEQLTCAQLQQATQRLEEALQSEQMSALLAQFGLPNTGDIGVSAFLRAIEKQARDKKQGQ